MDAKDVLRSPLKPFLDLLDRRVYNLAKLIDAKSEELKQPLAALNNGSDAHVLAGLSEVRQEIAGVDQRVSQHLQGLTRTTLGTQESYLESLGYVGRALREVRDEIGLAQVAELAAREGVAVQVAGIQKDLLALRAMIAAAPAASREDIEALRLEVQAVASSAAAAQPAVTREEIAALRTELRAMAPAASASAPRARLAGGTLADLDDAAAAFINYAASHRGFAAQAGLWLNHPVQVAHHPGAVRVDNVNERIVEVPFVFAALGSLARGARVLDLGGMESTVALSLASLGHAVTVIDPRGYPFAHPSLRVVTLPLDAWDAAPGSFDAIVCLSTIEHIGLGAYDTPRLPADADRTAMRRLRELASPGAVLALTVPFGARAQDDFQRTYDRPALDALLAGWQVTSVAVVEQRSPQVWAPATMDEPGSPTRGVALVTARAS